MDRDAPSFDRREATSRNEKSSAGSSDTQRTANTEWKPIGTVVGNAGTITFTFILESYKATLGDILAVRMEVPGPGNVGRRDICVWARITEINRFNPFFPYEAAHEISNSGISLADTVLSDTRDQLEAKALVLGSTEVDSFSALRPLTYPVKPASRVYYPPAEAVRQLLVGNTAESDRKLRIGSLIARQDVEVKLSASKLVSRHMAILAMTGGGKTVAARRIIRELASNGYPLVILDPHGDYIGLWKCRNLFQGGTVKLFFPELTMTEGGEALVEKLISQMTDGLTEPQAEFLRTLFNKNRARSGESAIEYLDALKDDATEFDSSKHKNIIRSEGTRWAVVRALKIVLERLKRMRNTNDSMRRKFSELTFEPLPNAVGQPERIVRPQQISIVYLGGYDHITQCSIAAILLDSLFEHRASLSNRIPPFQVVIEEAHTFIPSQREGTEDAVSISTVRRMITEGRKFGTGLILISQRPSRLDETIVSQCNSFLVLRLVNPKDQNFIRSIMENLTESDAKMVPGFGPGQGIVSGQVVRFPLPVMVDMDRELLASELGDEDFFDQVGKWRLDSGASTREVMRVSGDRIDQIASARRGAGDPGPKRRGRRRR